MGHKRLLLIVLDGYGWAPDGHANPLTEARTPFIDSLTASCRPALLDASGEVVGLPAGQVGNSEVGHLTMGAGRTVPQATVAIGRAIEDGFRAQQPLADAFSRARERGTAVHVIGLASAGGAHSHIGHMKAVIALAERQGCSERTFVHAVSDGRDVPARSAREDLTGLEAAGARLTTVVGRRFAMDRSGRWDRTDLVVEALTAKDRTGGASWREQLTAQYGLGRTDEELEPIVLPGPGIAPDDEVIMTNFRPDGLRQLASRLAGRGLRLTTMTQYGDVPADVAFPAGPLTGTLAQAVAGAGLTQVHVAEREKFGHVTYLLNGYTGVPQPGERHIAIDSRTDVPSFALVPEMSAREVTAAVLREIASGEAGFIVANLANVDSVGHTGDRDAVRAAAEVVDTCLADLALACERHGVQLAVTADHGNGEAMVEEDGVTPHTRHTTNPVPFWVHGAGRPLAGTGDLRDVAPTCLDLLGIAAPAEMTGHVI